MWPSFRSIILDTCSSARRRDNCLRFVGVVRTGDCEISSGFRLATAEAGFSSWLFRLAFALDFLGLGWAFNLPAMRRGGAAYCERVEGGHTRLVVTRNSGHARHSGHAHFTSHMHRKSPLAHRDRDALHRIRLANSSAARVPMLKHLAHRMGTTAPASAQPCMSKLIRTRKPAAKSTPGVPRAGQSPESRETQLRCVPPSQPALGTTKTKDDDNTRVRGTPVWGLCCFVVVCVGGGVGRSSDVTTRGLAHGDAKAPRRYNLGLHRWLLALNVKPVCSHGIPWAMAQLKLAESPTPLVARAPTLQAPCHGVRS